jgi:hypothetical protein
MKTNKIPYWAIALLLTTKGCSSVAEDEATFRYFKYQGR